MSKSSQAFRTIREVSDWLDVKAHVLRFWESKFPQIKPVKRAGGRRYYRPGDMELVGGIKVLLHEQGMTIKGVQNLIRDEGTSHVAALSPPVDALEFDDAPRDEIDVWDRELAAEADTAAPEVTKDVPSASAPEEPAPLAPVDTPELTDIPAPAPVPDEIDVAALTAAEPEPIETKAAEPAALDEPELALPETEDAALPELEPVAPTTESPEPEPTSEMSVDVTEDAASEDTAQPELPIEAPPADTQLPGLTTAEMGQEAAESNDAPEFATQDFVAPEPEAAPALETAEGLPIETAQPIDDIVPTTAVAETDTAPSAEAGASKLETGAERLTQMPDLIGQFSELTARIPELPADARGRLAPVLARSAELAARMAAG